MASFALVARRIKKEAKEMGGNVDIAKREIAEEILTDIKAAAPGRGVPVKTGALRGTGQVEGPNEQGGDVKISFGDAAVTYALTQHERVDFHHEIGESRYVVRGMERWRPGGSAALRALQMRTRRRLRRKR